MIYQEKSLALYRFLQCIIAGEIYCVRLSLVRGIKSVNELKENSTDETDTYPVINLDEKVNQHNEKDKLKKILIFNVSDRSFGISVESIENIFDVSANHIFAMPCVVGGTALHYFDAIVYCGEQYILSLSPFSVYKKFYPDRESISYKKKSDSLVSPIVGLSIFNTMCKKIIIFSTTSEDSLLYGLSITQISQILHLSSILPIPGAEIYVRGVIEWRNIILPIIDLRLYIENRKSDIGLDGRILVVRLTSSPIYIGIMIRSQIIIEALPIKKGLDKQDKLLKIGSAHRQFKFQNRSLIIPDIDQICNIDERS